MRISGAILLVTIAILASSCAKLSKKFGRIESDSTKVFFSQEKGLDTFSSLNGGVMIYALSSSVGAKKTFLFSNEDLATGAAAVTLKNGIYKFYLVGFSSTGMQGGVKCAAGNGASDVTLSGASQSISFTANAASCALSAFSPGAGVNHASTGFKALEVVSCQSGTSLGPLTENSDCTATKGGINHTRSIQVELVGYNLENGTVTSANATSGIKSSCMRGVGLPSSNSVYATGDTQANSVFTSDANTMFFGLQAAGLIKNTITSGSDSPAQVDATAPINEIHGYGNNLIAATNANGIRYSSDGGSNWSPSNISTSAYWSVFAASATNMYAGAGTAGNIYRSTNGGSTWSLVAAQADHGITSVETLFVASDGLVYAGGKNGTTAILASSVDNGVTWATRYSGASEGGVWVVKVLNGKLYWGTNNALYVSTNADGSSPVSYCSAGCTNTATLPGNVVQDVTLANRTLYVATSTGIGVNPGANLSTWENYGSAQLTANFVNVQALSFNNGRLYQSSLGLAANPTRSTDSRGSGAGFPASANPIVPAGNAGSFLATKVTVFNTPDCSEEGQEFFYPEGINGTGAVTPNSSSTAFRYGANATVRYFIND